MPLVVIGGIAAGLSAAARARRIDPRLEIVVLEQGSAVSYGACGLPYFVEGRVREAGDLVVHTAGYFRQERRIDVRTGARVTAISHPRREVTLDSGARVAYDKLVIATGARPDTSGIPGAGQPHVFTLHTLDDAVRMRAFLRERQPRRAVVVGGGYIGVEAADALRRNGLEATLLERSRHLLLRGDAAFTDAVRKQLEKHGVEVRCDTAVDSIEAGAVNGVACDMVVVAAGFRPNVELAAEAGIRIGRSGAIATDDRMETSLRGVFAAGDCAEVNHLVTGRPAYIPLGTTANKCGRVAGANAAGGRGGSPASWERPSWAFSEWVLRPPGFHSSRRAPRASRRWPRVSKPPPARATFRVPGPPWNWWPTAIAAAGGRLGDRRRGRGGPHRRDCRGARNPAIASGRIRTTRPGLLAALRAGVGPAADRRPATGQGAVGRRLETRRPR